MRNATEIKRLRIGKKENEVRIQRNKKKNSDRHQARTDEVVEAVINHRFEFFRSPTFFSAIFT